MEESKEMHSEETKSQQTSQTGVQTSQREIQVQNLEGDDSEMSQQS